ncbi:unnamed protein product [Effrenium voratum]|uniref:Uncharacterized protein n=1 Tax=Effrenium voratum TaxID=2562239 RepID=A0AA36IUG4_9DINO|nr:unnamed protein product [Effrenium voratum]
MNLVELEIPTLLPHEILHAVVKAGPDQTFLGGRSRSAIAEFWAHCSTLTEWKSHPALEECSDRGRLLPFSFHIDGAEFFRNSEFMVWSVSCALAAGDVKHEVHKRVAELIAWSMKAATISVRKLLLTVANTGLQEPEPTLTGVWKAAHIKVLMWYFTEKAVEFASKTGQAPTLQGGACCIWSLQQAITVMDCADIILEQEDATMARELIMQSLQHWQGLRQSSRSKRWKLRPKHHYIEHMAFQLERTRLNARHMSCFQDESYLGCLKRLAVRCHARSVLPRVFQRLILNLALRFRDSREAKAWRAQKRSRKPCQLKLTLDVSPPP